MWRDTTEMAQAVREKKVSSKELVTEAIEKIERLNPQLNAVVSKQYEQALEQAEMGDFSGKLFGGVPILLKDLGQQQVGELATSGSRLFANNRSRITDNYVKKLEELGFVILGRTNTPEFGFKNISDSSLHGAVNLPADTSRNAGGSSGGAAVVGFQLDRLLFEGGKEHPVNLPLPSRYGTRGIFFTVCRFVSWKVLFRFHF